MALRLVAAYSSPTGTNVGVGFRDAGVLHARWDFYSDPEFFVCIRSSRIEERVLHRDLCSTLLALQPVLKGAVNGTGVIADLQMERARITGFQSRNLDISRLAVA